MLMLVWMLALLLGAVRLLAVLNSPERSDCPLCPSDSLMAWEADEQARLLAAWGTSRGEVRA